MSLLSLVRLRHFRDNCLDPSAEEEFEEWPEFVDQLLAAGHNLRGPATLDESEEDYKLGFLGSDEPTVFFPVIVAWDEPLGDEEADWRFRERYGDDTDCRRRCNAIVTGSPAWIVLDIDTQTVDEWEGLQETLREAELDAVGYSSYSHGKDPKLVKMRLIVRASRPYSVHEIRRVRRGAGAYLGTTVDLACVDPARIFFLPAARPERAETAFFWRNDGGQPLDVDEILSLTPETTSEAARRVEIQLGVWDGREPADSDVERAVGELDVWCESIQLQAGGNFRAFTEQGTFRFGSYVGAGALELESTRARLSEAYLAARAALGDDRPESYRLRQIDTGLSQGARRPRLPFTEEQEAEIQKAVDKAAYELITAQLQSQRPAREVPLDEAREASWRFLDKSHYDELHVDASTVGVGKSFVLARVAAKRAREGLLTVIQTQEHAVGAQTREELHRQYPEVKSVHLYSSASPPPNAPADHRCPRLREEPELVETIFDYEIPLRRVCATQCDRAETCPALAAAKKRGEALQSAQVVFVSQAGVGQIQDWIEDGAALLTDEQPEPLKQTVLSSDVVDELLCLDRIPGLDVAWSDRIQTLLHAAVDGEEIDEGLTADAFPVSLDRVKALEKPARRLYRAAAKFYALATRRKVSRTPGGGVEGFLATAAHEAMLSARQSVLVDATPLLAALPAALKLHRQHVADPQGVNIERRMLYRRNAGSKALYGEGSVNERVVTGAVKRALDASPGRVLFVTFKTVREWLEQRPELLRGRLELAHFGAVRGKNAWKEVDVVYTLGTPRFDRERMLQAVLQRDCVDAEWVYMAAAELEQAMGRARHVSRTRPLIMFCEGSLAPLGWHSGNCRIVDRNED